MQHGAAVAPVAKILLQTIEADKMSEKPKICLVSCGVLREELEQLVRQGSLNAELVFVSKYFHIDYEALESNLRALSQAKT